MKIDIGNNHVTRSLFFLIIDDQELFRLYLQPDGSFVADVNIWDQTGLHIARLRRSAWVFNARGYSVDTRPNRLLLRRDGETLVSIERPEPDRLVVESLDLYAPKGNRVSVASSGDLELYNRAGTACVSFARCVFLSARFEIRLVDDVAAEAARLGRPPVPADSKVLLGGDIAIISRDSLGATVEQCTFAMPGEGLPKSISGLT
jgi:hypothetical protein